MLLLSKVVAFFSLSDPSPPPPHRPPLPHTHTHIHFVYSVYLFFYCCSAGLPKFWSTTIFITTLSRYNLTIVQEISLSLISLSSSTVIRRQSVVYCVFTGAFAHMIFSFPFKKKKKKKLNSFTSNNEGVYF